MRHPLAFLNSSRSSASVPLASSSRCHCGCFFFRCFSHSLIDVHTLRQRQTTFALLATTPPFNPARDAPGQHPAKDAPDNREVPRDSSHAARFTMIVSQGSSFFPESRYCRTASFTACGLSIASTTTSQETVFAPTSWTRNFV